MKAAIIASALVAAISAPAYAHDIACNPDLVNGMKTRCVAASDVKDDIGTRIYCTKAGEEASICASERSGSDHYDLLFMELTAYSIARDSSDGEAGANLNRLIIRDATKMLNSKYRNDAQHMIMFAKRDLKN